MNFTSLVSDIALACYTSDGSRIRAESRIMESAKTAAQQHGPLVPVGGGNSKTGTPSTYRPVGLTCPASCEFLNNGCYAQGGNVNIHQTRANDAVDAAVRAAGVAMVVARLTGTMARLHVSGDLGADGIDADYVGKLCALADEVNAHTGADLGSPVAWTYTHHEVAQDHPLLSQLRAHGVMVRMSGQSGTWGCVVLPFSEVPAARKSTGAKLVKCPAQLQEETACRDCALCWSHPDRVIVFDPHGGQKNKATDAIKLRK